MVEQRFTQDAARGIAGAQNKDIEYLIAHKFRYFGK
jgi:hypothetical protein